LGAVAIQVCTSSDDVESGYECEFVTAEVDLYRDTALRYLGYSNEVGEAFRPLVGNFGANLTYVVAVGYVLADSIDKAIKSQQSYVPLAPPRDPRSPSTPTLSRRDTVELWSNHLVGVHQ
jgi:hypothetical protein